MWTIYKNKKRIQKFKETRDSRYINQNKQDKACFQHDIAYEDFNDLTRRTTFGKILYYKAFNIFKNWNNDWYQRVWYPSMIQKFFNKKSTSLGRSESLATWDRSASGGAVKNENKPRISWRIR